MMMINNKKTKHNKTYSWFVHQINNKNTFVKVLHSIIPKVQ